MIVNQLKNKSFRTTAEYVLGKEEVSLLDSNMLGATPRQMSYEVAACRRYRPNLQQATLHVIFSLPYRKDEQGEIIYQEDLPDEKAIELVTQWREAMQVTNCLYFLARHRDRTHNHFHLVACRIRKDGSVVDDSWDYRRSEVVVRQLEKEFNLEPTPCSNERVARKVLEIGIETTVSDRRAPTSKQKHHPSGQPTVKQRLAANIDEACSDSPTVTQLIGRLQHQGVKVYPQFSTKGLFKEAIAFELDEVKVAGNKIGSAYSFPGLLRRRGVSYEPDRDMRALQAAAAGELVQLHETFSELLPERTHQPPQHKVKESSPIEGDFIDSSPNHLTHEVDEAEPPEESSLSSPVVEETSYALQQVAQENYLTLWLVFQQAKGLGKTLEIAPGSWVYEDKEYAFAYNSSKDLFSVGHIERGLLLRYQSKKLLVVGQILKEDIEAFAKYERRRSPQERPLPPSSPQRGGAIELG